MARVIIVGAGLGGLSAGLACVRAGYQVDLYEQAARFEPIGAGLTISPSVRKALDWLGVKAAFDAETDIPEVPVLLDWQTGQPLATAATEAADHLKEVRRIHRADMHRILAEACLATGKIRIMLDHRLDRIKQDDRHATAVFSNGETVQGDLLICADGLRSIARDHISEPGTPAFSGFVACRFMLKAADAAPFMHGRLAVIITGPAGNLTAYTVSHGTVMNCILVVRSTQWTDEGWKIPATRAELLSLLTGWNEDAQGLVAAAPEESMFRWALWRRPVADPWVKGLAVLLGDAAHPVLPSLGMGAGLAIEDAVVLGRCLAEYAPSDAISRYERARIGRALSIQRASEAQAAAFDRLGRGGSAQAVPMFDTSLFSYDPSTTPI